MVVVKSFGQLNKLSICGPAAAVSTSRWRLNQNSLFPLCVIFGVCLLLVVLPQCSAAPTFEQGLASNYKGFFDSIDKAVVLGDESSQLARSYGSPRSHPSLYNLAEVLPLQRRSASAYTNRRNAHPCRWKLCGAYSNYSNSFRRFHN